MDASGSVPLELVPGPGSDFEVDDGPATELWRQLLDGRWVVAERRDVSGRMEFVLERPGDHDRRRLRDSERRVLQWARFGSSNKWIAAELGLSPSTVAQHMRSGLAKLGLESRVEWLRLLAGR